jgi:hypothetical protein
VAAHSLASHAQLRKNRKLKKNREMKILRTLKTMVPARLMMLVGMLCYMGLSASATVNDKVYIKDFIIKAGETKEIAIYFDTEADDYNRLTGTIQMPEELTVENDAYGTNVRVRMASRANGALGSYNPVSGRMSITGATFLPGTTPIAYMKVTASRDFATSTITLSGFQAKKGDTTVNIPSQNATATLPEVEFAFAVDGLEMTAGESVDVEVNMTNNVTLTGLQATLAVSEGLTVTAVSKGERLPGTLNYNASTGNIVYLGSAISGNEGTMFTVTLSADADFSGDATLTISNIATTTSSSINIPSDAITLIVTVDPAPIVLDENATSWEDIATTGPVDVRVIRSLKGDKWNTLCLPFDMDEVMIQQTFGDNVQIAELDGYNVEEMNGDQVLKIDVLFSNVTTIAANRPVIIKPAADIDEFTATAPLNGVESACSYYDASNKSKMTGVYHTGDDVLVPENSLFITDNAFNYSTGQTKMKGFRAYFTLDDVLARLSGSKVTMSLNGNTTSVMTIVRDDMDNYYDLNGMRVEKPVKGIFIKAGKKVVIK